MSRSTAYVTTHTLKWITGDTWNTRNSVVRVPLLRKSSQRQLASGYLLASRKLIKVSTGGVGCEVKKKRNQDYGCNSEVLERFQRLDSFTLAKGFKQILSSYPLSSQILILTQHMTSFLEFWPKTQCISHKKESYFSHFIQQTKQPKLLVSVPGSTLCSLLSHLFYW